jgi:hypothetical protein
LRFINGYSPILAAGVAREFKFAIHGEIDPDIGRYLSEDQSGPAGILEQLGVDGIVVAQEVPVEPGQADWQLIVSDHEGRVFQRRGDPLPRVRSITWIDSRPSEEFAIATISRIEDSRNRVELDVSVPDGARPALLTFSRPYFRGYTARLGRQKLAVLSYRGLIPIVEIPPHSNGRLVLAYRPGWLVYGGALSCGCGAFWILAAFVLRRRS